MTNSKTNLSSRPSVCPISETIEKLRQLTQINVQANWRYSTANLMVTEATQTKLWHSWPEVQLNAKGHIAWAEGNQVLWLGQQFLIPQNLYQFPLVGLSLRLALTWWAADAQIFVNGQLVQAGDLFDSSTRILLSSNVTPGEVINVALRLVSPGHDGGALMRSLCLYEAPNDDQIDPSFVADELAILQKYLTTFAPDQLDILNLAVTEIDWAAVSDREKFMRSLELLRQNSKPLPLQNLKLFLLGHSHLDMAWLWTVSETWEVAQRTFTSVFNLQQEFPELIYCHSTPALYAWIEQHRPDLFTTIQKQVKSGKWEVVGGMWIEPDLNLIAGESIVRQILYGQRYVQEKFGELSTVAWLADTFGFCATLPQFLQQGGIEYFVTQKLRWNDTNQFPHQVFWWQSPDGSQVFSLMSAPIGEGIEPVKMANYAGDWETKTGLKDSLWLPGVGDHGGGPTRDMLAVARRWQKSPFFPKLEFIKFGDYLQQIRSSTDLATDLATDLVTDLTDLTDELSVKETVVDIVDIYEEKTNIAQQDSLIQSPSPPTVNQSVKSATKSVAQSAANFPIWRDELYLEFHRGCYTTHADQKRRNRRCEQLLYEAELWTSLAAIAANHPYPQAELEAAWKQVLFNQFHDILPGTAISQVLIEANQTWQAAAQVGEEILAQALSAIAAQITLPPPPQPNAQPILIFNSLNWQRSEVVSVTLPTSESSWEVWDLAGKKLVSQWQPPANDGAKLLFLAPDIPAVGYRLFWLSPQKAENFDLARLSAEVDQKNQGDTQNTKIIPEQNEHFAKITVLPQKDWISENELLRVTVDGLTGDLASVFDKVNHREILSSAGGNQLQSFQDSGQYWDAWNIDPNYAQHPLPSTQLQSIEWIEQGQVQQRLRVVRLLGKSQFCQDYILSAESPLLKIATTVDWQEHQVLVKAAFPLNLQADLATYEIPCGAIARPTNPQTAADQAKWEVPALRWADISNNDWGVSLLNDCKYGYDAQPSQLRLTLLRSPSWPNPDADQGWHQFTYALYPHAGNWQRSQTVRRGYELNLPLQVIQPSFIEVNGHQSLPSEGSWLDLSAENLILLAFKRSEDNAQQWILRCYECCGETADLSLQSDLGLEITRQVDLLERPIMDQQTGGDRQISPWKIVSYQCLANFNLAEKR